MFDGHTAHVVKHWLIDNNICGHEVMRIGIFVVVEKTVFAFRRARHEHNAERSRQAGQAAPPHRQTAQQAEQRRPSCPEVLQEDGDSLLTGAA